MANDPQKITQLDEATAIPSASWFAFVDATVSTPSPSGKATGPGGTDFKVSKANLIKGLLPSQSGQAGKVLSTDGTSLSWAVDATGGSSLPTDLVYTDHANTFTVSPQTIVADADGHKGLIVKAHSATQSASLQEWQDSTGSAKTYLDSGGHLISKVHAAFGNVGQLDEPISPNTFTLPVTSALLVQEQITSFPPSGEIHGTLSCMIADPSGDVGAQFYGLEGQLDLGLAPGNPDFTVVNPHNFNANVSGVLCNVNHWGSGTASQIEGVYGLVNNLGGGTMSTASAGFFAVYQSAATGGMGNCYGVYVDATYAVAGTTVTNCYGIYLSDQSPNYSPGVVNHWNIYSDGSTTQNTFVGSVLAGGTTRNHAAAILQADSTTQGFLPPRMTTTQRDAISSPPEGLVLYNTTSHKLTYRNNSTWIEV